MEGAKKKVLEAGSFFSCLAVQKKLGDGVPKYFFRGGASKTNAPDGAHTHTHTEPHGDSMTELAQWGRFSENSIQIIREFCSL